MAQTTRKTVSAPANGKGARSTAANAVAELSDHPRLTTFRGVALTLPAKLPATFALDMAEVQGREDESDLGAMYRLLVGLLGRTQWLAIRNAVAVSGDSMDGLGALFTELLTALTDAYGMTPGEPPASATS